MAVSNAHTMTLDGKEILLSEAFIIPDGGIVRLEVPCEAGAEVIKVQIVANSGGDSPRVNWSVIEGDRLAIEFSGFKLPLPSAIKQPQEVGRTTTGKNIFFIACISRLGEVTRLDFQLLLESTNG